MNVEKENRIRRCLGGKKILIWGAGREGTSTYHFLRRYFPHMPLSVADSSPFNPAIFQNCSFINSAKWTPEFNEFDLVFKSPGIDLLDPAIQKDRLTSQTQIFLQLFRDQVIGVTGTKGKSTTSSLLYHILNNTRGNTIFVGNIGIPCLDLADAVASDTVVVFEMSCHQLECVTVSPHIGVILNLYEDHLDHYGTYEAYIRAKERIFLFQQEGDVAIINSRDQAALSTSVPPVLASMDDENADIFIGGVDGDLISIPGARLDLPPKSVRLPGRHNRYNIAVAYYICTRLGVDQPGFLAALASFRGLPHRLEYVGTFAGVDYYDDSISTICETTIQALKCLKNIGSVILGGMDRGIDYLPLANYLSRAPADHIILMPDTGERIRTLLKEAGGDGVLHRLHMVPDLKEAVHIAKMHTRPGQICLLSPAAASYGFYKNFEERGDAFQAHIKEIE